MSPQTARKPASLAQQDIDAAFLKWAKKIAADIKDESAGNFCRDCTHAVLNAGGAGVCTAQTNIHGATLSIIRQDAIACRATFARTES